MNLVLRIEIEQGRQEAVAGLIFYPTSFTHSDDRTSNIERRTSKCIVPSMRRSNAYFPKSLSIFPKSRGSSMGLVS